MAKAIAQITIRDDNDITIGTTAPPSPVQDQLWLDTASTPSVLKRYKGNIWEVVNEAVIGGRNLVKNSNGGLGQANWIVGVDATLSVQYDTIYNVNALNFSHSIGSERFLEQIIDVVPNTQYTLSFYYGTDSNSNGAECYIIGQKLSSPPNTYDYIRLAMGNNIKLTYTKHVYTFTTASDETSINLRFDNNGSNDGNITRLWLHSIKLEKGNVATDWSPAPEDLQTQIDSANTTIKAHTTDISDMKGNISTLIQDTTVTLEGGVVVKLKDDYSSTKQTVGELSGTVSGIYEDINGATGIKTDVTQLKNSIQLKVTQTEINKAFKDAVEQDLMTINPIFNEWGGQHANYPTGMTHWSGTVGTKETTLVRSGTNALRFNVALNTDAGANFGSTMFKASAANYKYVTVELSFYLVTGGVDGAGVLIDWSGMATYRTQFKLQDMVSETIVAGKWYTITKVFKRPSDTLTGYNYMTGYLMANYSALGTRPAKDIVYDRFAVRASSQEEIKAYDASALLSDIANDNKLTAMEKQLVKGEWDAIVAEKPTLEAQADAYLITTEKSAYTTSYNTLNTYITPLVASLNTTSDIVGTTFRTNFKDYYDKKALLLKKITDMANSRISSTESSIDSMADEIDLKVSTTDLANGYYNKTSMDLKLDNVVFKFSENGGDNVLKNGKLKKGLDFFALWEYSLVGSNLTRNLSVRNDVWTGYQNAIQLQINSMTSGEYGFTQWVPTVIGKKYVFTCYLAGHRSTKKVVVRGTTANESNWLASSDNYGEITGGETLSNWQKVVVTFTAQRALTGIQLCILNTIGTDGYLWAKELMVSEGDSWKPYSAHPSEIYEGNTIIDSNGVTISNGALTIKNKAGNVVMAGDANGDLYIQNSVKIGGNTNGNLQVQDSSGVNILSASKNGIFVKDSLLQVTSGTVNWDSIFPQGSPRTLTLKSYGVWIDEMDVSTSQTSIRRALYQGGDMRLIEDNSQNAAQDYYETKVTARQVKSSYVHATANGDGKNYLIGDDCWLGDINEYATVKLHCTDNTGRAYLRFGNGAKIGYGGGSGLDIYGNIWLTSTCNAPRFAGTDNTNNMYVGNGSTRMDTTDGHYRLFTSPLGSNDYGIIIESNGSVVFKTNSVTRHILANNGGKTGGSMEIDGTVYGMSPTDSPQTLIEYIEYDINVEGTMTIPLDPIYVKMVSKYAVFCSNPDIRIIKKNADSFVVTGTGIADFNIKGQRRGAQEYYKIMGGFEHGTEENVKL